MRILLILVVAICSGCANTSMTSFSDPDFKGKRYSKFIVSAPNTSLDFSLELQNSVCEDIKTKGAVCSPSFAIFPPTRALSNAEKADILKSNNIDAVLAVIFSGGNSKASHLLSTSYGNTSIYGGAIQTTTTSVPVYAFSRNDNYNLILIDTQTHRKAWIGSASITASGIANTTNSVFIDSLSKSISSTLAKDGHL